jgi:hypothetical protein
MGLVDFTAQRDPPRKLGLIVGLKLGLDGLMLGLKLGFDGIVDGIVLGAALGCLVLGAGLALGTIVDGLVELGLRLDGLALGTTDGPSTDSKGVVVFETSITLWCSKLTEDGLTGSIPMGKVQLSTMNAESMPENTDSMRS